MSESPLPEEAEKVLAEADLLHSAERVEAAMDRLAEEIAARLGGRNPLLLAVPVGGIVSMGCMLRRLHFPLQLDYLHVTRYRGGTRGGEIQWLAHPSTPLKDRVVLVVDDILDEGLTLTAILEACRAEGAREGYSAVLVEKLHDRKAGIKHADFTALTVPDRYVFGYGMDYRGYLRNAPGIYAVKGM